MPKWTKPEEGIPDVEAGDRVLVIIVERDPVRDRYLPRLAILEATETGWTCSDETYSGYTIEDCSLWSLESDVTGIVRAIGIL